MPVLSTTTVCTNLPYTITFEGVYGILHAGPAPDWFGFYNDDPTTYGYTIDPVPAPEIGDYSINIYNASNVLIGTIEIHVEECNPAYEINICMGEIGTLPDLENPPTEEGDTWVIFSAPDWVTLFSEPFEHSLQFLPDELGTIWIVLQSSSDPSTFMQIKINITNCYPEYDVCPTRKLNIVWFLPECGWKNYIFAGKKIIGVDVGSASMYTDENDIDKFSSVEDVHDSVDVASGEIPKNHVSYLKFLKLSIQAYVWDSLLGTLTEINIDKGSFQLYREGDSLYKYNFRFTYGKKIIIQHQ